MDDTAGDGAVEIAEIEQGMRSDYREYSRNPGKQERYLELLKTRDAAGSPEPRAASAVDKEIAVIENRIKTDTRGYEADLPMQERYTELLGEQQREHAKALAFAGKPEAPKHGHYDPPVSSTLPEGHSGHGHGHAEARPVEEIMTELGTEPEAAALLKRWGADAADNTAYMAREATEILNALPLEEAQELQATVDAMTPGARAKLYAHLADAGRARVTR